jgi:CHAT domain-containing protein
VQGNEWLGLGGAFLTAGARTVIASANRVSDLAAAVLMKRFYRALRRQSAGEALQRAALTTRRYFPHPAHWANFVLVGDFR